MGIKARGGFGFCTRKTIPTGGPCVCTCPPARTVSPVWAEAGHDDRGRYCQLTFPQCHFQHPPHPSGTHRQLFPGRFEGIGSARSILEHPPQKKHCRRGTRGRLFILHHKTNKQKTERIWRPNPDVCSTNSFIRSCFDKLQFQYLYSKSFNALSHTKGQVLTLFFKKNNNNIICFII